MALKREERRNLLRPTAAARLGGAPLAVAAAGSEFAAVGSDLAMKHGSAALQRQAQIDAGQVEYNRDEDGHVVPPRMPEVNGVLGPTIYQAEFQKVVGNGYRAQSILAGREKATEMATQYAADPAGFSDNWKAWRDAAVDNALPFARAEIATDLDEVGSSTLNQIVVQHSEKLVSEAVASTNAYVDLMMRDAREFMADGNETRALATLQNATFAIKDAYNSNMIDQSSLQAWHQQARMLMVGGQVGKMIQDIEYNSEAAGLTRQQIRADYASGELVVNGYEIQDGKLVNTGPKKVSDLLNPDELKSSLTNLTAMMKVDEDYFKAKEAFTNQVILDSMYDLILDTTRNADEPINVLEMVEELGIDKIDDATTRRSAISMAQSISSQFNVNHGRVSRWAASEEKLRIVNMKFEQYAEKYPEQTVIFKENNELETLIDIPGAASNMLPGDRLGVLKDRLTDFENFLGVNRKPTAVEEVLIETGRFQQAWKNTYDKHAENMQPDKAAELTNAELGKFPLLPNNEAGYKATDVLYERYNRGAIPDWGSMTPQQRGNMLNMSPVIGESFFKWFVPKLRNIDGMRDKPGEMKDLSETLAYVFEMNDSVLRASLQKRLTSTEYRTARYLYASDHLASGSQNAIALDVAAQMLADTYRYKPDGVAVQAINRIVNNPDFELDDISDFRNLGSETSNLDTMIDAAKSDALLRSRVQYLAEGMLAQNNGSPEKAVLEALQQMRDYEYSESRYGFSQADLYRRAPSGFLHDTLSLMLTATPATSVGRVAGRGDPERAGEPGLLERVFPKRRMVENIHSIEAWYADMLGDEKFLPLVESSIEERVRVSGDWNTDQEPQLGVNIFVVNKDMQSPNPAFMDHTSPERQHPTFHVYGIFNDPTSGKQVVRPIIDRRGPDAGLSLEVRIDHIANMRRSQIMNRAQ